MNTPRRVVITGTSRGIGRDLALHFLGLGDRVIGCSRSAATIEHADYQHLWADVADPASVRDLFRKVRETGDLLDAVINNAGTARMAPVALTPPDTVRRIFEINFLGAYHVSQEAIRLLRKSKQGRIVNLTSIAVPLRLEGEAAYAASKAAVESLTRILAKELGPLGITCNAVGPSPIETNLIENVPRDKLDALIRRQAAPVWATAQDVANVIEFYPRPESQMITGQIIYLGGFG
jgi:3-oxoacyl-[acyl-carrier protein] reductase